jgi:hypothetical protein
MGYGEMVKWDIGNIHIDKLTMKFKIFINEKLPFKTNIPLFQYSIYSPA